MMDNTIYSVTSGEAACNVPFRFMRHRIHKILLVCCSYDGYILEEDGHIEAQINQEYMDLNMSNPPSLTRVSSTSEALERLESEGGFDFILTMYNVGEPDVFAFSRIVKERYPKVPVVLLTSFSKDIYRRIEEQDRTALDYIFCWHGNADLIIAIIKLIEDRMNADKDILEGGVQSILLVEDSIRYYSTYLPAIYKLVLLQNSEFLKDAYNEQQQILRKRARPKILLATNYEDAVRIYQRYKGNLLGVISDVGFPLRPTDRSSDEKKDAGIDLCRLIKEDNPLMPILLQSSEECYREQAEQFGVGFIQKNSKTLHEELAEYIGREFAFGDFEFRDPVNGTLIGRANDLRDMQRLIAVIPDSVFEYHTSQNHLSKWLYARGLFPLAASIRALDRAHFDSIEEHRQKLVALIRDYRTMLGQGVVARFDPESYSSAIGFARLGEGSLGGKARGLAFINSMLQKYHEYNKYEDIRILIPRTIVIATDYFDRFIKENELQYVVSSEMSDEELLSEFVASRLPEQLIAELKAYLTTVDYPLAVRSSSKLEDSHYQPFAGIYSTYMIPNTEDKSQMLRLLSKAIKSVYASVYFAASRAYIATSSNLLSEEKMAVIVQQVCGTLEDGYFFPTLSGVARSINHYPIGDERAEEGIVNIALGLGKMVVDGGQTLRFSPRYPQKALQTSTLELTLRDTQREFYALDMRPSSFHISSDDSVNLARLTVADHSSMRNVQHAASTWNMLEGTLSESPFDKGRKLITFNRILKYGSFPLAQIIENLLAMGEQEMRCPVEMEFAVNLDVKAGNKKVFNFLQIRPIISTNDDISTSWDEHSGDEALIYAERALGVGAMHGISDIIYVKPQAFDNLRTEQIAAELLALNARMRDEGRGYVLVGPGRWGSSDPFLGIPVKWSHISEARVIVECGLENFRVEPSQGTHFFQNVTSLGIGYLTINPYEGDGVFDVDRLNGMTAAEEGEFLRRVSFEEPLVVYVDGRNNRGVVKIAK